MPMLRYGSANLVKPGITPDQWVDRVYQDACAGGQCRMKTAKEVIAKYDPTKYLLSHCTIIASVDVDNAAESKSQYKDFLIKPELAQFVNNNGDAWTRGMLLACYKTFVGANNYLEHVQIPELSKGKVIDAAPREIVVAKDKEGKDLSTIYVDILVATDRKHKDLCRKIEARELTTLSMGCMIAYSICSKCGNVARDETEACSHVRYEKKNSFYDENGIQRIVAELCGHESEPDSVKFVDASWVKTPAFTGAVMRNVIDPPADIVAKLEAAHTVEGYQPKEGDYLKAAKSSSAFVGLDGIEALIAQDEPEEETVTEETLTEEAPAEDAPADTPVDEGAAPAEETPSEEIPPEGGVTEESPEGESEELTPSDIRKWRAQVQKEVMKNLGENIVKTLTQEDQGQEPTELETLDESIIKPASDILKQVWKAKKAWDTYLKRTAGTLHGADFDKLRYGTWMLMTSRDAGKLAEYGFKKRDFLAVLSYLDRHSSEPLPLQIKKAVSELGGTRGKGPVELLSHIVSSIGRKLSRKEASRCITWLKMLDLYRA